MFLVFPNAMQNSIEASREHVKRVDSLGSCPWILCQTLSPTGKHPSHRKASSFQIVGIPRDWCSYMIHVAEVISSILLHLVHNQDTMTHVTKCVGVDSPTGRRTSHTFSNDFTTVLCAASVATEQLSVSAKVCQ